MLSGGTGFWIPTFQEGHFGINSFSSLRKLNVSKEDVREEYLIRKNRKRSPAISLTTSCAFSCGLCESPVFFRALYLVFWDQ